MSSRVQKYKRWAGLLFLLFLVLQVLLMLLSWFITAAAPDLKVRSLLSGEGLRWLFGSFTDSTSTPLLVWLLLLAGAAGTCWKSRILPVMLFKKKPSFLQRFALQMAVLELMIVIILLALLTLVPHAPLVSITGALFPSDFSFGLIPLIALVVFWISLTYGFLGGAFHHIEDLVDSYVAGLTLLAPSLLVYFIMAEFYASLCYVFSW